MTAVPIFKSTNEGTVVHAERAALGPYYVDTSNTENFALNEVINVHLDAYILVMGDSFEVINSNVMVEAVSERYCLEASSVQISDNPTNELKATAASGTAFRSNGTTVVAGVSYSAYTPGWIGNVGFDFTMYNGPCKSGQQGKACNAQTVWAPPASWNNVQYSGAHSLGNGWGALPIGLILDHGGFGLCRRPSDGKAGLYDILFDNQNSNLDKYIVTGVDQVLQSISWFCSNAPILSGAHALDTLNEEWRKESAKNRC